MKKLTSKVIWLFAIGQLGWSILSALVTNWIITFYEPDTEMLKAGQTLFMRWGVCSTLSQIPGLRICRTGAGIRRAGGFHS